MQLAITALGNRQTQFIEHILPAVSRCKCNIIEISLTELSDMTAAYMIIEGNWNHLAKLENLFEGIEKQLNIKIHQLRQDKNYSGKNGLPYALEVMSLDQGNVVYMVSQFLAKRNIHIVEIKGSQYPAAYVNSPIFTVKFIIIIPSEQRLLELREDFLDFCDQSNFDAILEPIKR